MPEEPFSDHAETWRWQFATYSLQSTSTAILILIIALTDMATIVFIAWAAWLPSGNIGIATRVLAAVFLLGVQLLIFLMRGRLAATEMFAALKDQLREDSQQVLADLGVDDWNRRKFVDDFDSSSPRTAIFLYGGRITLRFNHLGQLRFYVHVPGIHSEWVQPLLHRTCRRDAQQQCIECGLGPGPYRTWDDALAALKQGMGIVEEEVEAEPIAI